MELLAPAGGYEQLRYALHFGADAVYIACEKFGLRARAGNFSLKELPGVVSYVHNQGARVYVACNAYIHDGQLSDLEQYAQAFALVGVDGIIVSDLGVFGVLKRCAPQVPLHVSTQASVSNAAAACMWYELGARRVVCAREMSLNEIAAMRAAIPADMEIEAFVHGAMCMSISGRCLISDFLTGRHANQGNCVQPCRWEYTLKELSRPAEEFGLEQDEQGSYIFSSKDLNMLAYLPELEQAGVTSIKIEGRNKKAFYVASVVNAYRQVLDGAPVGAWEEELNVISHRPYSTGFYFGPAQQSVTEGSYEQLCDWVAEVVQVQACEGQWRIQVRCRNRFYEGDVLEVLSPHRAVRTVHVSALAETYYDEAGQLTGTIPVEYASKAMGYYEFTCECELQEHDMIRSRRKDPTKKN